MAAEEEFADIRQHFVSPDPIQHDYEVIRPIVLFAETAAERSRQTGVERTVVGDKAQALCPRRLRMDGLRDRPTEAKGPRAHGYPDAIAEYILYLKQLYPPIHLREIVADCATEVGLQGQSSHPQTVFGTLCTPPPTGTSALPTFGDLCRCLPSPLDGSPDGGRRVETKVWRTAFLGALAVSCLYDSQGVLDVMASRAWRISARCPPQHPENQLSLPFLKEVLDLQQAYPRARPGFGIHGLLEQQR